MEIKENEGLGPSNNVGGGNIAGCNSDDTPVRNKKKTCFIIKKTLSRKKINEGIGHALIGKSISVAGSVARAIDTSLIPSYNNKWIGFIPALGEQSKRLKNKNAKLAKELLKTTKEKTTKEIVHKHYHIHKGEDNKERDRQAEIKNKKLHSLKKHIKK